MSVARPTSYRSSLGPAPAVRHVLYEFDGPKMVLAVDDRGRQLLGIAVDEDDEGTTRWIFAPAPPERALSLLITRLGLRGIFESGQIEVYDIRNRWEAKDSWSVSPDDVPEDWLPERDAELPELVSSVRTRLIAEQQRFVEQRGLTARTSLLFSGAPVRGRHGITATFAAQALASYQDLVALASAQQRNVGLSSVGRIPGRAASTLMLTEMPRGSVGFELVEDVEGVPDEPTHLSKVVSLVGALLDAAATGDAPYAEAVAEFDRRVVTGVNGFFEVLKKADASLRLDAQNRQYMFDADRVFEAVERTAFAPDQDDDRPVSGMLIGYLPMDHRFEFQAEALVIKGRVARELDQARILPFFQKPCIAHMRVVTVRRQGQITEAFTLLDVKSAR